MTKQKGKIIYRIHMVADPYCTICERHLAGDDSIMNPYYCDCGEWEHTFLHGWKLIKKSK